MADDPIKSLFEEHYGPDYFSEFATARNYPAQQPYPGEAPKPDITDRAAMLPVGWDAKGGMHWAVPRMLYGPAQTAARLFGQGSFLENPTPQSKSDMATLLASIYAGNALNPAARAENAVGAGIKAYRGVGQGDKFGAHPAHGAVPDTIWATSDPTAASEFALGNRATAPAVYPVDLEFKNPLTVDFGGKIADLDPIAQRARARGHDALIAENVLDTPDMREYGDPATVYAALAPNTVRSSLTNELLNPQGIKAYHGSPYDFDRFDASKIGTGEGAQAYGHGLYFAENENVAKGYRDNGWNLLKINGETVVPKTQAENDAASALAVSMGDPERALRELVGKYSPAGQVIQDWVERGLVSEERGPGKMYEVNINASPDQFLDWDTPEQPPEVRQKIESYLASLPDHVSDVPEWQAIAKRAELPQEISGAGIYNWLAGVPRNSIEHFGGQGNQLQATEALNKAGIPGIRYLDQGSRGKGQGTYNYVVFPGNEHLVSIVRKYAMGGSTEPPSFEDIVAQNPYGPLGSGLSELRSTGPGGSRATERPSDPVAQPVAESISPTMGAYGAGQLLREAYGDLTDPLGPNWGELAKISPLMLGIFAGPGARTADMAMLSKAQEMAAKGAERGAIWNETGWFQGPDQKWRFEIPDDKMSNQVSLRDWLPPREEGQPFMAPNVGAAYDVARAQLTDQAPVRAKRLWTHEDLAKAYPHGFTKTNEHQDIMSLPVQIAENNSGMRAGYLGTPGGFVLNEALPPMDAKSALLHELQHAVQDKEGFAPGSNPNFGHKAEDVKQAARMAYEHELASVDEDAELLRELGLRVPDWMLKKTPWEQLTPRQQMEHYDRGRQYLYHRAAGEVEARNVQARMRMTPGQRRATPPWETQDVPDIEQILGPLPIPKE